MSLYIKIMKKKDWGNAVWLLFHTLAEKLKDEHFSELAVLVSHISQICSNLPCPDCQNHAIQTMNRVNQVAITSSKEALIHFLWQFHNDVNKRTKTLYYPKESLNIYKTANTQNVVKNFIKIMSATSNNEKTMLHGFHRNLYMKQFINYINQNIYKYNP
jgi:hypothetical protein